jgi:antitoxin CcdA
MSVKYYDVDAPRKAANLSVNSDLLRRARTLNLNLSQLLEASLVEIIRQAHGEKWLANNRAALENYDARIECGGAFSGDLRSF